MIFGYVNDYQLVTKVIYIDGLHNEPTAATAV